jgi:hypothetical protein
VIPSAIRNASSTASTPALRRPHVVAVWLWVALALGAIYLQGRQLGVDRNVTNRLRYHAIPIAISVLYHGRPYDYTAFKSLAMRFQSVVPLDSVIIHAVYQQPPADDATYYWVADDRGMSDYVIGAFYLFGPRTSSLYSFYFVVLGVSCLLFLADAGRHAGMNVVLILAMGAIYSCLLVMPLVQTYHAFMEPASPFEPRMIELLSYVATLHLAFTTFTERPWSPRRVVAVVGQAAVLVVCYHARSALVWQVAFVLAAGLASAVKRREMFNRRPAENEHRVVPATRSLSVFMPAASVLVALLALAAYRHAVYNSRYFEDMGSRTFWHNSLMGLGSNEQLAATYGLRISDSAVIDAVILHLKQTADPRLTAVWTNENIRNSLGNWFVFNWFEYEGAARDLYWHIWRAHWPSALRCYLVDKPVEIVNLAWRVSREATRSQAIGRYLALNQFSPGALLIILPAVLVAITMRVPLAPIAAAAGALLLFSALPALVIYPVVSTMMGLFASLSFLVFALGAMLCGAVFAAE